MTAKELEKIDDAAQYRVTLKARLDLFGQAMYPGHEVILRGDVIKAHAAAIASATKIEG